VWLDQVSGSMRLYSVKMMKSTVSDYDFHAAVKLDKWRIPQHDDGQGRLPVCWRKARKGEGLEFRVWGLGASQSAGEKLEKVRAVS